VRLAGPTGPPLPFVVFGAGVVLAGAAGSGEAVAAGGVSPSGKLVAGASSPGEGLASAGSAGLGAGVGVTSPAGTAGLMFAMGAGESTLDSEGLPQATRLASNVALT
jgi:hypothetical protein